MNLGDVVGMAIAMGGLLGMVGMLTEAYKARLRVKERQYEAMIARSAAESGAALPAETERLEARIRVLERIATDGSADRVALAHEIDRLREPVN